MKSKSTQEVEPLVMSLEEKIAMTHRMLPSKYVMLSIRRKQNTKPISLNSLIKIKTINILVRLKFQHFLTKDFIVTLKDECMIKD